MNDNKTKLDSEQKNELREAADVIELAYRKLSKIQQWTEFIESDNDDWETLEMFQSQLENMINWLDERD